MFTMTNIMKFAGLTFAVIALSESLSYGVLAASDGDIVVAPEIVGPSTDQIGSWRTKTQQVFDPIKKTLIRRVYTVWDPESARDLDFVWGPTSPRDDKDGRLNGPWRLVWRLKGKPSYDPASIFAEYQGSMKDGRAEGYGSYFDRTGIAYDGQWSDGSADGRGTLSRPDGTEYTGSFRGGKANGIGRYVDLAGEIFEGQFSDGLRQGPGTTTLPNGSSYRSNWLGGKEREDSRFVRLAQVGGQQALGGGTINQFISNWTLLKGGNRI
jgi:hypothetical protein